jgi:hypothetical protein
MEGRFFEKCLLAVKYSRGGLWGLVLSTFNKGEFV